MYLERIKCKDLDAKFLDLVHQVRFDFLNYSYDSFWY